MEEGLGLRKEGRVLRGEGYEEWKGRMRKGEKEKRGKGQSLERGRMR